MNKNQIFKTVGVSVGVVTTISLVATNPFHVFALVVGAALYFYGDNKFFSN